MRNIVSIRIGRLASLSAQPTAFWYAGRPSLKTIATAPAIRLRSTYDWSMVSMRASRSLDKPEPAVRVEAVAFFVGTGACAGRNVAPVAQAMTRTSAARRVVDIALLSFTWTRLLSGYQPVSITIRLANIGGMTGIGLQLVAKPEDEVVHRARQRRVGVAPDQVQQLVPRDHLAGSFGEAVEDLELPVGQLDALRATVRLQPPEVDDGIAQPQLINGRLGPAQHGVHARQQFVEREGLGHVVVGTKGQSADAILLQPASRQDDDWNTRWGLVQSPADLEPIGAVREHHIEQEQIRRKALDQRERVMGGVARVNDKPLVFQVVAEQPGDCLVVFDDEDALGHVRIPLRAHAVRRPPVGSVTSTSVPSPDLLRTSIRPPWLSTMRFAIGRPRPLPLAVTLPPR